MLPIACAAIDALKERGLTVATCESLTGGMICAALVDVPGASRVVRGGLITYQTDTKTLLAGVDESLIAGKGVVSGEVAAAMAQGTRSRLGVDIAVSATGMASPGNPEDPPAGTVYVGLSTAANTLAIALRLPGDRQEVRRRPWKPRFRQSCPPCTRFPIHHAKGSKAFRRYI